MNVSDIPFPVEDTTQISTARRAALQLADRLGFSATRAGQLALVVTELGTNLAKHARHGEMLLGGGGYTGSETPFVEVLALDRGPGLRDVARSRVDGYSTTGTLGHGLGAIERQSDFFDVYTRDSGTAILARVDGARRGREHLSRIEVGAVRVNATGEQVCGDDWGCHLRTERLVLMLADGLGHGLAAHDAARQAVAAFDRVHEREPLRIMEEVHGALRSTRGAAVAALAVDLDRGVVRYSAVGNIASVILTDAGGRQGLVTQNGTAGHGTPRLQEFQYAWPPRCVVVMHSDGLRNQWDLAAYPGLQPHHPSLIAGVLYRDFSRRRDDVTVIIAKDRPPV